MGYQGLYSKWFCYWLSCPVCCIHTLQHRLKYFSLSISSWTMGCPGLWLLLKVFISSFSIGSVIHYPVCCKHVLEVKLLICLLLYNSVELSISLFLSSNTRLYKLQKSAVLSLTSGSAKLFTSYMRLSKQVHPVCSLDPRPLSPEERPGTHCLRMCKIFRYIFCKILCALHCPYAEDYTNQEYRAFFELDSSNDLSCRPPLGYYFSDMAVSFFQTYSPTER